MTSADHVVWDNLAPRGELVLPPEQQFVLRCTHCGERFVLPLPASVDMMAGVCKLYAKAHRRCKPREPKP